MSSERPQVPHDEWKEVERERDGTDTLYALFSVKHVSFARDHVLHLKMELQRMYGQEFELLRTKCGDRGQTSPNPLPQYVRLLDDIAKSNDVQIMLLTLLTFPMDVVMNHWREKSFDVRAFDSWRNRQFQKNDEWFRGVGPASIEDFLLDSIVAYVSLFAPSKKTYDVKSLRTDQLVRHGN